MVRLSSSIQASLEPIKFYQHYYPLSIKLIALTIISNSDISTSPLQLQYPPYSSNHTNVIYNCFEASYNIYIQQSFMSQGYYTNPSIYPVVQRPNNDKFSKPEGITTKPRPRESQPPLMYNTPQGITDFPRTQKDKETSFTQLYSPQIGTPPGSVRNDTNGIASKIGNPQVKNYVNPYSMYPQSSIQPRPSRNITYQDDFQKKTNLDNGPQSYGYNQSKQINKYEIDNKKSIKEYSSPSVSTPGNIEPSTKRLPRFSEPAMYNNQDILNPDSAFSTSARSHNQSLSSNVSQHSSSSYNTPSRHTDNSTYSSSARGGSNSYVNKFSTHSIHSMNKKSNQVSISDFIKGAELGAGKFGTVYVARHKATGFLCAIKEMSKKVIVEQNILNQFIRQIKIQSCLEHPNVIKLYGFFHDKEKIYLVLELGSQGQLYKIIKEKRKLSEATVSFIIGQLCEAVKYFHSLNVIHRDIKPENIVVQYGIVKICDFGWSVCRSGQLRSTFCGTPLYVSPQILKGQLYDQKIDIWALGILTYQLLVGDTPFEIFSEQELVKIIVEDITFPSDVTLSSEAKDFILRILKKNPDQRIKIAKLIDHPFLQKKVEVFDIQI